MEKISTQVRRNIDFVDKSLYGKRNITITKVIESYKTMKY